MELRLRPQPNGFLHGELVVHMAGYGPTPIEGFVRGDRLQFQVPYGGETYYFEGERSRDELSGTFESTPSGQRGTWTTHPD
jgi:YHS domain-containing protein